MTLYKVGSWRVIKVRVSLNVMFSSSVLYILRSEMSALVAMDIWKFKRDKEGLDEVLYCGFSTCREIFG